MEGVFDSVLDLIGRTPLVTLGRVAEPGSARVLGKLESLNPSGSVKDRIALALLEDAEAKGEIAPGDTLVWATSGNSGVALAMVAAAKDYRLTIFMPSNAPVNIRRLLERYGADLQLTSPNAGMRGSNQAAEGMANAQPGAKLLEVFDNPQVAAAHQRTTAREIIEATGGAIDCFVAGVGTGGTITGVARGLKEANLSAKIVAVEPAGSPVLSGGAAGRHLIPGIGPDFVPPLLDLGLIDSIVQVTDAAAGAMSLRLAREEGLLMGISSGANVFAALQEARELGPGRTVVTILADTGERYLDYPI